jgi:3-oxoacyl-[acyl-carrier-protein] synthase II
VNGRRVAVTGLGFVTPIGMDDDSVWASAVGGVSGVGPITLFDARQHATRIAAEVKGFVPEDFMEGKRARNAARFCQFALAAARKALADADLDPAQMGLDDVGVIVSSHYGGMLEIERAQIALREAGGVNRISPFAASMMGGNMAPAFIAMNVGAGGINYGLASACASSGNAIGEAAEVIKRGDAKVVLAGGAEASITPLVVAMYNRINATSVRNDEPDRASRPWDVDRDGFVWGEGSVILVLEDWEHAVNRGHRIRAELAGYGSSIDMYHYSSPHPEGVGAARAISKAIAKAGVDPTEVDYVNAHATSTKQGDIAETRAIKRVFGGHAPRLAVSSTKSVHGHLHGAAGAIEAAICVLALERQTVPPTINLENQDPSCDLDYVPRIARKAPLRVAISNSFGLGGHNITLVIKSPEGNGRPAG